jgi:large subunit ribosomal protein L9
MQVILKQTVPSLGKAGELVTVKSGYGRNYLLPQGLAVTATQRNKSRLEHDRVQIEKRMAKLTAEAETVAQRIGTMTLQFERLVGADEKLFGSVTTRDIAEQLKRAGVDVDHRRVLLNEPVRALGKYEVDVRVGGDALGRLKFWVVGKEKEEG